MPPVVVPNVMDRPVEDALAIIDKVGLARGNVAERPAPGRPGLVLEQSLRPGTRVPRGTPLHLAVSQVPPVIVPNVMDRPVEDALAQIDKVGLARGNVAERPAAGRPGLVLEQSLTPGTRVPRGTPLHLAVSQVPLTVVPNVLNRPIDDALAQLDKAGLTRGTVADRPADGPRGLVLEQSLTPGTRVPRGTRLNLSVSQTSDVVNLTVAQTPLVPQPPLPPGGPSPPPLPPGGPSVQLLVPAVVGRSITDARALVSQAGLTVGTITERGFFLPPFFQSAGTIFQQQPAAGTALAAPVLINLVVLQRFPAWAIMLSLALIGAALALVVRRRPVPPSRLATTPEEPPPPPPGVRTHVFADRGDQRMPAMNPANVEIRLRHTIDRGTQSVREVPPPSSEIGGPDAES